MADARRSGNENAGWRTKVLPSAYDEMAHDRSEVSLVVRMDRAGMAHFRLPAGATSAAVEHRTIEEYRYPAGGIGELWMQRG